MSQRRYGVLLSYVLTVVNVIVGLVFTPFFVNSVGKEDYGLYNIVGAFVAYLTIMDLGINSGVVRFVTKFRIIRDKGSEENFLAVVTMIYAVISVIVVLLGAIAVFNIELILHESVNCYQVESVKLMLMILIVNVVLTLLCNGFSASIIAYERFVFLRTVDLLTVVLGTVLLYLFLLAGYGVLTVVLLTAFVNIFFLLVKVAYAIGKLGVRMKPGHFRFAEIKDVVGYSLPIFVGKIVELIFWKLDNIILGILLGPATVAIYAIGMSFHKYFMRFSDSIAKVMLPKIVGEVEKGANGEELTDILIYVSRMQAMVLLLPLTGLIMFGSSFVTLWVGGDFHEAYLIMLVTLIPYSFELIGSVRNGIMEAKRIYWYRSISILIVSLINIPATIYFVHTIGMVGAAMSTGAGIFLCYIFTNYFLKTKVGIEIYRYNRELVTGIVPAVLISVSAGSLLLNREFNSWSNFFINVATYTALYGISMWIVGMNRREKEMIRGLAFRS